MFKPAVSSPNCPWCGGVTEKVIGIIATPALNPHRDPARHAAPPSIKKLGSFTACTGCEYCEEL